MESKKWMQMLVMIISAFILATSASALSIPAKPDGFLYKDHGHIKDTIMIQAFFDPVCPDSRDAWPPLKQVLEHYGSRLSLTLHPFALPYHDNSFIACRALHVVNKLNASATYHMLELMFTHQDNFYNQQTRKMSRASVVDLIVQLVVKAVGNAWVSAVQSSFNDRQTDLTTRFSFKYGCSRGVHGTPSFFVNGFPLPDGGSPMNYNSWRSILDPLVQPQSKMTKECIH